jgi:hypothetical protein
MSALRASALSAAFIGQMWLGAVRSATDRPVRVRLGRVWPGPVTADDLSAEPFVALRWVL